MNELKITSNNFNELNEKNCMKRKGQDRSLRKTKHTKYIQDYVNVDV